ncbi:MAG: response regulator [Reichenbachiella sp.]|uniref:response regulator n=1 Tax=Reichenbachiella sp. TaxID=2184521 RepID=UPI003263C22A
MKKILIIEDNTEVRENTCEILELAGYQVMTVVNGKEGVEVAQKDRPDLIICDIMMPELDGYGVLHILSKNPDTSDVPFIFLTAKAEKADFRKGMSLGADDYLTKPFEESELLDAIDIRIKKSEIIKKDYTPDLSGLNQFITEVKDLEELRSLSADRKVKKYKKKSIIYWEKDYNNYLIYIVSGKVKTYKTNHDGKQLITGMYGEGDFIGYRALLAGSEYTESAMTIDDVEICKIPKEDFFNLLYANRQVANKFIQILSNNLAEREEQLLHLAYNSVRQKVAEKLLEVNNQFNSTGALNWFTIPREDLASMAGTAQESVIRTLSDFKDESLVEIESGKIRILNINNLERLIIQGHY